LTAGYQASQRALAAPHVPDALGEMALAVREFGAAIALLQEWTVRG
jgi:hypothetical protein